MSPGPISSLSLLAVIVGHLSIAEEFVHSI